MKFRTLAILVLLLGLPVLSSARWIEDKAIIESEGAGKVEFSHYNHLEALGKNCPTCHNSIFNIVSEKNPTFTMADMEKGKSCGACHNGTRAFSVADDCSTCHPTRDITFALNTGPAQFSHEVHLGMGFSCSECHPGLFIPGEGNPTKTMGQMAEGESCGACHDGSTAFGVTENCTSCHPVRDVNFETDAGPAVFSHEAHLGMGFSCSECHPDLFLPNKESARHSMDEMAEGVSCGACHDGSTAFTVEENCDTCHQM